MTKPPKTDAKSGKAVHKDIDAEMPKAARVVQKREFVDRVVAATGAKKGDVRPIVEATLDQLGQAFAAGETLVINPFGRARVSMKKDNGKGSEVINLRLRRRGIGAEADED